MQTYPTGYAESHRIAEQIFREILPRHGMAVREEQIALCHEILDTLYNKEISLCEAGVGIGKTLAYLVACILWQMHRPSQLKMPVVISTSSVALQDAILNEYWYPKTHQWYCRHCGMWSNRIRPEELSQQLREKLFWICRHNERICSPQGASNIHSIESSRLSHEINTLLASPEPDAESIVRKILHRAELQFTCCSAGDADPATLQIKRACNELEPTDTFPLKLYAEIVSNVILYRDTHIEIKLRNGQIL